MVSPEYPASGILKRQRSKDKDPEVICFIHFKSELHNIELPEETASYMERDGFFLEDAVIEEVETYAAMGVAELMTPWQFVKRYIRAGNRYEKHGRHTRTNR